MRTPRAETRNENTKKNGQKPFNKSNKVDIVVGC